MNARKVIMRSLVAVLVAVSCSCFAAGAVWSETESASARPPWREPFPSVGGKPWVVTGFRFVGTLLNEEQWLNHGVVVPAQIGPVASPIDRQNQNQLPLLADVVVFP